MDEAIKAAKEKLIAEPFVEKIHFGKERLASLLVRSQMTDAEYEHLKRCPRCVETVRRMLRNAPHDPNTVPVD